MRIGKREREVIVRPIPREEPVRPVRRQEPVQVPERPVVKPVREPVPV